MKMYKVFFRDGNTGISRAIKVWAYSAVGANREAARLRGGYAHTAVPVANGDDYVMLKVRA